VGLAQREQKLVGGFGKEKMRSYLTMLLAFAEGFANLEGSCTGSLLAGGDGVFFWSFRRFLRALVTANGDFLAVHLNLDPAFIQIPITHHAFCCIHKRPFFLS
jgi:hypothetical protein